MSSTSTTTTSTAATTRAVATATAAAAARQRRAVTPAQRVLRLARSEARMLVRQRTTLLTLLSGPLAVLFIVSVSPGSSPAGLAALTGMGVVVVLAVTTHVAAVMLTVNRREAQVLKRLRTSELSSGELVAGTYLPLVVAGVLEALAVLAVVAGRGGPMPGGLGWAPWVAAVLLAAVGLVAAGVAVAGMSGNAEKANWAAVPLLFAISIAANLLTAPALPEAARQVLLLVPFTSAVDLLARSTGAAGGLVTAPLVGGAVSPVVVDLALLAAWTAVSVGLARRLWRWEPRG